MFLFYLDHMRAHEAKARIGEEQTKLHRMEEHTLGLWTNVRSSSFSATIEQFGLQYGILKLCLCDS